jgi:hypothetical protein
MTRQKRFFPRSSSLWISLLAGLVACGGPA